MLNPLYYVYSPVADTLDIELDIKNLSNIWQHTVSYIFSNMGENSQLFGLWSAISLGWLTLNVFGGTSFIMFVGLSAGGVPALLYGL